MIQFDKWRITNTGALLARQYDHLTRELRVVGELPDGWSWDVLVQAGKRLDIIRLSPAEGGLSVTLTAEMLALGGYYAIQLRGIQGEQVRHTNVIQVYVGPSLSGDAQWPTIPTEFTQLEQRVQASAAEAQASAEAAAQSAQDAETAAQDAADQTAQQLRSKFEALAKEASDSAQSAEASAKSASAAAGSAAQSASAAGASANQAAASAQSAAAASSAAAQSASGALAAAGTAQSAATQAQQSAESASQQAQTAGDHAADADQSAKSAADAQVSAETAAGNAEQSANAAAQSAQEADAAAENAKTIIDDTTAQLGKTWSSLTIVDRLAPAFEASGPVVTCNPVKGYPLNVVSQIVPVQEGSGDPSPENVRPIKGWAEANLWVGGKNVFNKDNYFLAKEISFGGQYGGNVMTHESSSSVIFQIPAKPGQAYYFYNPQYQTYWLDRIVLLDPEAMIGYQNLALYTSESRNYESYKFTFVDAPTNSMFVQFKKVNGSEFTQEDVDALTTTIGFGEIKEDIIPYNPTSQTITLPFGQVVYGGTLDWNAGVLTVTHAEIASYSGEALPGAWISDRDVYSQGATPTTGAQVVYELSVPRTIQLTTTEMLALSGANTIYTDTGNTTVSGRADPNTIIQQLAARIAALESAVVSN